jgi:hypothetical protein
MQQLQQNVAAGVGASGNTGIAQIEEGSVQHASGRAFDGSIRYAALAATVFFGGVTASLSPLFPN